MRLFKLIVEIKYPNEKPDLFKFREKIISGISKSEKQNRTNITDGFQFFVKEKLIKVMIESNRAGADIIIDENIPNPHQFARDNLCKLFKQINSIVKFPEIQRIGVRGTWIHLVDFEMDELIRRYKQKFYKSNAIIDKAADIALVLTLRDNENIINYTSGAMDKKQLSSSIDNVSKSYGQDPIMSINKDGIYFDYDYYSDKTVKYTDNFLLSFINDALARSKNDIEETLKILEILI